MKIWISTYICIYIFIYTVHRIPAFPANPNNLQVYWLLLSIYYIISGILHWFLLYITSTFERVLLLIFWLILSNRFSKTKCCIVLCLIVLLIKGRQLLMCKSLWAVHNGIYTISLWLFLNTKVHSMEDVLWEWYSLSFWSCFEQNIKTTNNSDLICLHLKTQDVKQIMPNTSYEWSMY